MTLDNEIRFIAAWWGCIGIIIGFCLGFVSGIRRSNVKKGS